MRNLALALIATASAAPAHALEQKIACVDMQKAVAATTAGKKARAQIEKELAEKRQDLQKKEGDFRKLEADFKKKAPALSDEARGKQMQDLQAEATKFQRDVSDGQAAVQKLQVSLVQPLIDRMQSILTRLASEQGYTMVLEKGEQGVLFTRSEFDLTDSLVKEFEKSEKPQ